MLRVLLCVLVSTKVFAGIYLDAGLSMSYTQPTNTAGVKPTLVSWGTEISLGYQFSWLIVGAASSIAQINQYSALDTDSGNYRGNYFNFAGPLLAVQFGNYFLRVSAQFLGRYKLAQTSYSGASIEFRSPLGGRLSIERFVWNRFALGGFYERTHFRKRVSSTSGTTNLAPEQVVWQAGAVLRFIL